MSKRQEFKTLGDAIGMPDEQDKAFIVRLIKDYERKYPGRIKHTIQEAKKDQYEHSTAFDSKTKYGLVGKQAGRRHIFELPEGLVLEIERWYPTMFREKKHFAWFVKNFKDLMIPEKY